MSVTLKEINCCEVCGNERLYDVLDLGLHPLCDDLVEIGEERKCKEFPIVIQHCATCHTSHQKYQVPKENLFTFEYHYRARMTASVLSGMKQLVLSASEHIGNLAGKFVIDVGCNDGSLLEIFEKEGSKVLGVEPTSAALDCNVPVINSYFDDECVNQILKEHGKADVITFTNVFAHIENLNNLLKNVDRLLKADGVLVIENHYLGAVLDTGQFDTFYHEHPRTYSETSFQFIAKKLKRNLEKIEYVSRYGGNIRVFVGAGEETKSHKNERDILDRYSVLRDDMDAWKVKKRKEITDLVEKYGPVPAKAFPGRAAILIKLLSLSENEVGAVYEISGSLKTGHYVPGTRIPILPERELFKNFVDTPILNLAWHLPSEVRANLQNNGVYAKVLDIKEANFAG